jgi:hypothetical protein
VMGFGAIIATGTSNAPLGADIADCLIEARIEQSLDEPTRYGVRVREDIADGKPIAANAPVLQAGQMLTIAVQLEDDSMLCLVRGPITDTQSQYTLGGPGSWYEVHGTDRRVELSRQCFQHAWEGRASDAAGTIISRYGFDPDIQDTNKTYSTATETLNQRGTDLDFLKTIAKENGYFFWLSYVLASQGLPSPDGQLSVTETAHLKTSPFRAQGPGGVLPSIAGLKLVPTGAPQIKAGADNSDCGNNVTAFKVKEDAERASSANVTAIDTRAVSSDSASATDPTTPLAQGGQALTDVTGLQRTLCVTAAGNAEDARARAEAALSDTGWFVTATASTTAHMLKGVLQPHDIVEVVGVGPQHSIPFRVRKVTHVITPSDHYMDVEMQGNSRIKD